MTEKEKAKILEKVIDYAWRKQEGAITTDSWELGLQEAYGNIIEVATGYNPELKYENHHEKAKKAVDEILK